MMAQNGFILLFVGIKTGSSLNRCFEHCITKDSGEDIETNIMNIMNRKIF